MSTEDRLLNLEAFASDVREHTRILTEILRRYDERLDEHTDRADRHEAQMTDLRTAHAETERAIAALADAQIRTEDALKRVIERLDAKGE